jgi:hypothetical protein
MVATLAVAVLTVCAPLAARAETLTDTLIDAYRNSNLLEQNRAVLRAADEDVAIAVSALRPVVDFISERPPGGDSFTAGPAIGAVLSKGKWTYGIFNQNFIGSETELSSLQPVIGYQLGNGYSLSAGDAQFTYDWKGGQWVNLPLGVSLNKVTEISGQPLKLSINPEYNFRDIQGASQFTLRFGLSLIF